MSTDSLYMKRCLEIAFSKIGLTSPNPAVGALIVKDGIVLGEGGTGPYGSDHAEVGAIKNAISRGNDITGADIYVSLEPCSHYGKTPPCTEAIKKHGIKRAFIPLLDPNPLVSGNGVRSLIDGGVEVRIMHEFRGYASDLLRAFKKYILRHKPFIINKCAVTLDGRIASDSGDSKWISNDYTRLLVHKLRAKVDAVIIGGNTLVHDNPMLNVRITDFDKSVSDFLRESAAGMSGSDNFFLSELIMCEVDEYRDPLRVLAGFPEDIKPDCSFLRDDNYIIVAEKKEVDKTFSVNADIKRIADDLNLLVADSAPDEEFVSFILEGMKARGVMTALLEGGGGVNGSFFNAGAIDQFMYVIAPRVIGSGISPVRGRMSNSMSDALILREMSTVPIGDNLLFNGYKEEYNFEMM